VAQRCEDNPGEEQWAFLGEGLGKGGCGRLWGLLSGGVREMNTPKVLLIVRTVILLSCVGLAYTETSALSDPLQQYAQKCDRAIGITVPDFVCSDGTVVRTTTMGKEVPTTFDPKTDPCDRPNVLNSKCDPGSYFQVLPTSNADAYAVAHCRKQEHADGFYGDIAVIQHNKKNGATCFYQALGNLNGNVKAPSKGTSAWPWLTPMETAAIGCVTCHDNGPIIRSPYLSQVTDRNDPNKKLLPGAEETFFNRDQPYFFVGNDFASWKAYKVEVEQSAVVDGQNTCNDCHRMGVTTIIGTDCRDLLGNPLLCGTALDLGIRATDRSQEAKDPHSPASPIWMTPDRRSHSGTDEDPQYSLENMDAAQEIKNCALRLNESLLPNSPSCRITLYTGGIADIDNDGDVDRDDLTILLQDRGKSVSQSACGARCDLDGDGHITGLDARELILLCSRSNCATQ
jgi:hypothetical protein